MSLAAQVWDRFRNCSEQVRDRFGTGSARVRDERRTSQGRVGEGSERIRRIWGGVPGVASVGVMVKKLQWVGLVGRSPTRKLGRSSGPPSKF